MRAIDQSQSHHSTRIPGHTDIPGNKKADAAARYFLYATTPSRGPVHPSVTTNNSIPPDQWRSYTIRLPRPLGLSYCIHRETWCHFRRPPHCPGPWRRLMPITSRVQTSPWNGIASGSVHSYTESPSTRSSPRCKTFIHVYDFGPN